jgi:ribosome-associated heat shock protein Hsp15
MNQEQSSQRLDKWLWSARFFKSRALATKLLSAGRVRLSGKVITKSNQLVKENEVLTFPQGSFIRVIKVLFLAERRGPATEARLLFEDLSPIEEQREAEKKFVELNGAVSDRPRGGGRPTKDDRRAIDRLMRRN